MINPCKSHRDHLVGLRRYPCNAAHYFEIFFIVLVLLSQYNKLLYVLGVIYFFAAFVILLAKNYIYLIRSRYLILYVAIPLVMITAFFIIKTISEEANPLNLMSVAHQYFGWLVFYYYFSLRFNLIPSNDVRINTVVSILRYVVFVIIAGCVIELFYGDLMIFRLIRESDDFDRVYGIATRPSSSAVILVASSVTLAMCSRLLYGTICVLDKYMLYAAFLAFLTIQSGVGVVVLLIAMVMFVFSKKKYNIIKHRSRFKRIFIFMMALMFAMFFAPNNNIFGGRLTTEYITFLLDIKLSVLDVAIGKYEILMGFYKDGHHPFGSDFAIFSMIGHLGIIGFIIFLLSSAMNSNYLNRPGLTIMLVSLIHYGAIFVSSGSMVFGIIVSIGAVIKSQGRLIRIV